MMTLLTILWAVRTVKAILFWLYLWQLKEYHIGRFIDHFRTAKGKQIFLNPIFLVKLVLFAAMFYSVQFVYVLFVLYALEALQTGKQACARKLLKPVFTKKVLLLFSFSCIIALGFTEFPPSLLLFDIFTPIAVSFIVLIFQPFAVWGRQRIIENAKKKRDRCKNLIVVGITGSYGKTSTKEFLAHILSQKFKVLKTKEHQNSEVGISQCILHELDESYQVFVCEMGAYNRGGIRLLASIAKPTIGMLTGINEQHMATFGSQENIIKAKYELIESLPSNGVAFFNARNRFCVRLYDKTTIRKELYGQNARFPGEENILGAIAVAKELGMSQEEIARGTKGIADTFPGVQITTKKEGLTVIDATYSANPDGAIANLGYLETFPGKKVLVMPCLIELGSAAKEVHERIGKKIAETCDLAIITTQDRFEDIKRGAGGSGKIIFIEEPIKIVGAIKNATKQGDVVLLEGRVPQSISELL